LKSWLPVLVACVGVFLKPGKLGQYSSGGVYIFKAKQCFCALKNKKITIICAEILLIYQSRKVFSASTKEAMCSRHSSSFWWYNQWPASAMPKALLRERFSLNSR